MPPPRDRWGATCFQHLLGSNRAWWSYTESMPRELLPERIDSARESSWSAGWLCAYFLVPCVLWGGLMAYALWHDHVRHYYGGSTFIEEFQILTDCFLYYGWKAGSTGAIWGAIVLGTVQLLKVLNRRVSRLTR